MQQLEWILYIIILKWQNFWDEKQISSGEGVRDGWAGGEYKRVARGRSLW